MQEVSQESPQARQLAALSHFGSFHKAYRGPGLLLFIGVFFISGFLGIAFLYGPGLAVLGILCLGFSLMSLLAAIGHFYSGRVSLYIYEEGFVRLRRNIPLVVRWNEIDTLDYRELLPRNYGYSHSVVLTNGTRLSFIKTQGVVIEQHYLLWLMERWLAGETLSFGSVNITKEHIHVRYTPIEDAGKIDKILAWDYVETLWIGTNENTLLLVIQGEDESLPSQQHTVPLSQLHNHHVLVELTNGILADEAWIL